MHAPINIPCLYMSCIPTNAIRFELYLALHMLGSLFLHCHNLQHAEMGTEKALHDLHTYLIKYIHRDSANGKFESRDVVVHI